MGRRAGDPPHLIGSPKRINEEMGWHAQYNVERHREVRLGCMAGQSGTPHRRRDLETDRLIPPAIRSVVSDNTAPQR